MDTGFPINPDFHHIDYTLAIHLLKTHFSPLSFLFCLLLPPLQLLDLPRALPDGTQNGQQYQYLHRHKRPDDQIARLYPITDESISV